MGPVASVGLRAIYDFGNYYKEPIKNVSGAVTFVFGLYEMYDLSRECLSIYRGRVTVEQPQAAQSRYWRSLIILTRFSILLSGATSRPGVALCKWSFSSILTPQQLESLIGGASTNFVTNPAQLRHRLSILASLTSIPAALYCGYRSIIWIKNSMTSVPATEESNGVNRTHLKASFNLLTGRPLLHLLNSLIRGIIFK